MAENDSKFKFIGENLPVRILFLCSRILPQIRSGTDLRVQSQIASSVKLAPTAVFSIEHSKAQPVPGVEIWSSGDSDKKTANFRNTKFISELISDNAGPYQHRYNESTASKLRQFLNEFEPDHIIVSKLDQTVYLEILENYKKAKLILDLDESSLQILQSIGPIISNRVARLLNTKIYKMICAYESRILPRFSQIWVSSEIEVARIKNQYGLQIPVVNIPNSIDFKQYAPESVHKIPKQIIFPANFGHYPNEDAAKFMANQIIPIMKGFRFQFVGSAMPKWMQELSIKNLEIISSVPSMAPFIQKAGIMFIPLRAGAGTRLKALEAFACKTPVVSTRIGIEGLGVEDRKHVLLAETPEEFANVTSELISKPDLYNHLAESAYEYGLDRFSYETIFQLIKNELQV